MPTVQVPAQLTIEHMMAAVQQMSAAEWREFKQRLAEWEAQNGAREETEAELIAATRMRLLAADERRLRRLIARHEREDNLSPKEWEEYRSLVQQAERLDVTRVEALAKLVQRRGKPARIVMQEIGWKSGEGDAQSHPARRAARGA